MNEPTGIFPHNVSPRDHLNTLIPLAFLIFAISACGDDSAGSNVTTTQTSTTTSETTSGGTSTSGQRPVAVAGGDQDARTGEDVAFSASESFDPDGRIEVFLWDFGNGRQGQGKNVTHVYDEPGTYQVTLEVIDNDGLRDSDDLLVVVEQTDAPPSGRIQAEQIAVVGDPFEVSAEGSSDDNGIASYLWDFGEGSPAVQGDAQNDGAATYTYATFGEYTVTLTVADDAGQTAEERQAVRVLSRPRAVMEGPRTVTIAQEFTLRAENSFDDDGTIVDYQWIRTSENSTTVLGFGPTLTTQFEEPGGYNIAVTVTDNDGLQHTAGFKVTVELPPNEPPVADCGPEERDVIIDEPFRLSGSASQDPDGQVVAWEWDLGDGSPSDEGEEIFTAYDTLGEYDVTLTVTDNRGDSAQATCRIRVVLPPNELPVANCGFDREEFEVGETVTLDGSSSLDPDGSLVSYIWDFGDASETQTGAVTTHTWTTAGEYTVTLTVTDDRGDEASAQCVAVINDPPNIPPTADCGDAVRDVEVNTPVSFDASASRDLDGRIITYVWDFADGTPRDNGVTVEHTFTEVGEYTVTLTVTDDRGDEDPAQCLVRVALPPNDLPNADCGQLPPQIETGQPVTFNGTGSSDSDGTIEEWSWDPGDGRPTLFGEIVTTSYATAGDFVVTLTVTDDRGGRDASTCPLKVVPANQTPTAHCGDALQTVYLGEEVTLNGALSEDSDGDITAWDWSLGDGSPDTSGVLVDHLYQALGDYVVTLTVTDDRGATDTAQCVVRVEEIPNEPPVAVLTTPLTVAVGENAILVGRDSYDNDGEIVLYHWDFGDGEEIEGETLRQIAHTYTTPGIYIVRFTVTDDLGATDTAERTIQVTEAPDQFEGTYDLDPRVSYTCAFGLVNISASQLTFSVAADTLTISGAPTTMTQTPLPDGDSFSATGTIFGDGGAFSCDEVYTVSGSFTGPTEWEGTFNISFNGPGCGFTECTNQTFPITGARID